MIALIGYLALILGILLFLIGMTVYTSLLIYSSVMGSPYVPTKQKEVDLILREARLHKKDIFIDLGCGDGRVVRTAVGRYGVSGLGVDINPLLLFIASVKARWQHLDDGLIFLRKNIFDIGLLGADYVYLFLMPDLIAKLKPKLQKELKKGALVISHGFKITGWDKFLTKKLHRRPFPTYFYRR